MKTTTIDCSTVATPRFVVIDRDSGEKFSTTVYADPEHAARERNRLALRYGKETCLGVGYVDDDSTIVDVTEEVCA